MSYAHLWCDLAQRDLFLQEGITRVECVDPDTQLGLAEPVTVCHRPRHRSDSELGRALNSASTGSGTGTDRYPSRAIEIEMLRGMRSEMALDHEEYMREWGDDD